MLACRVCRQPMDCFVRTQKGTQCTECASVLIEALTEQATYYKWWAFRYACAFFLALAALGTAALV